MDKDKIVTVESYYDPMLAHLAFNRLEYNGMACYIADEYILWAKPYYNQLLGGVKLRVFEKDLEECREILAVQYDLSEQDGFEFSDANNINNRCTHCGSTNTKYGIATEPKFNLLSLLVSIFFFVPVYFRNAWHCFNCHRDF